MDVRYSYAKDVLGKYVHIEQAHQGVTYFCPQCGNEMIARHGEVNAHHFAHKVECACSGESYLHKIAKERFKELYDNSTEFILEYKTPVRCPHKLDVTSCVFASDRCNSVDNTIRRLNLKKLFDQCLIEQPINNGQFVADIILKDSTGHTDKILLIEFYHTHRCGPDKINSGYPIVEIRINNDEDIITSNRIAYNSKVTLYGFKPASYSGKQLYIGRFNDQSDACDLKVIKANCIDLLGKDHIPYHSIGKAFAVAIDPVSYREFSSHPRFKRNPPSPGEIVCAIAYKQGFNNFDTCAVCAFSRRSQYCDDELWCTESKNHPELPKRPEGHEAFICDHYFANTNRTKFIAKHLKELRYKILRSNPSVDVLHEGYDQ